MLRNAVVVLGLLILMASRCQAKDFGAMKLVRRYDLAGVLSEILIRSGEVKPDGGYVPQFSDLEAPWRQAVAVTVGEGLLQGFDGKFHGTKLVNRYQLAVILAKMVGRSPAAMKGLARKDVYLPADVPKSHWAAGAIRRAMSISAIRLGDGNFGGKRLVNRLDLAWAAAQLCRYFSVPQPSRPPQSWDLSELHGTEREMVERCLRLGLFDACFSAQAKDGTPASDVGASVPKAPSPSGNSPLSSFEEADRRGQELADAMASMIVEVRTLEDEGKDGRVSPAFRGKLRALKDRRKQFRANFKELLGVVSRWKSRMNGEKESERIGSMMDLLRRLRDEHVTVGKVLRRLEGSPYLN